MNRLPKFLRRRTHEPSVPPVESPAHYDAIGNWVPPGGYDGHHHAHNPETCPACDIERETGEVAPPAAHLWMRPTDLTEEEWARFKYSGVSHGASDAIAQSLQVASEQFRKESDKHEESFEW
jgi:hypothetical protein